MPGTCRTDVIWSCCIGTCPVDAVGIPVPVPVVPVGDGLVGGGPAGGGAVGGVLAGRVAVGGVPAGGVVGVTPAVPVCPAVVPAG